MLLILLFSNFSAMIIIISAIIVKIRIRIIIQYHSVIFSNLGKIVWYSFKILVDEISQII